MSFCELKSKEIVNEGDGKRLGRIIDLVFSLPSGKIDGIVAPFGKCGLFRTQEIYIPWKYIRMIGEDVIIVQIPDDCLGAKQAKRTKHDNRSYVCSEQSAAPENDDSVTTYIRQAPPQQPTENYGESRQEMPLSRPECDFRCEKCMLFDCADRWKR